MQRTKFPLEELASLPQFYHPVASPSGDRIAFYYDGTGRNELYVVDVESGEWTQASDGEVPKDAKYPVTWGADGERIYFHKDRDGDEQNDLHALSLEGDHEVVVDTEGQNHLVDVHDGQLLYASTKSGQMNLHRYDTGSGEDEQLTDYDQPVRASGVSPSGDRLAYTANESEDLNNLDVYVAEADGSDPRKLEVGESGVETTFSDWAPDGSALLVGDETTDRDRCGIYDLERETVEWFGTDEYEERPVGFTPDGDQFLAVRMRECGTVPVVYDRATGDSESLELADGVASFASGPHDGTFLEDGDALLTYTTPESRPELYRYDLGSDNHEVLIEAEYGDIDPAAFVDAEYVTYESTGEDEVFDVEGEAYEIEGLLYDSGERPSPGIVMVHGGPHARASKRFSLYAQFLVSRGYTIFQPNYRGSTGRGREFKNAIHGDWGGLEQEDVAEAGRWLEDRDWIDEDRVGVFGGSYGGYSAYMQLVKHPQLWATGVAWVGITDLHSMFEESMPHFKTTLRRQMGDPEENADLWRERSPLTHVENIQRPVLIAHGVNDPRCPIGQARQFRDALEEMGWAEGEQFVYEELGEEGHGSTDIDQKIRAFRIVSEYLDDWL